MALVQQNIPIGQNLNGTPGQGEVLLSDVTWDDTQRAELLNVSIQSGEDQTTIYVRLAAGLAEASLAGGPHIQLGIIENDSGLNAACCRCIVPRGWNLYAFTTGPVLTIKTLIVDWRRVTLKGEV
jgi:hypothetical protein